MNIEFNVKIGRKIEQPMRARRYAEGVKECISIDPNSVDYTNAEILSNIVLWMLDTLEGKRPKPWWELDCMKLRTEPSGSCGNVTAAESK